jgi:hypothetical protein
LRVGAVWTLALGHVNSGSTFVCSKLLDIVAKDLSNDVRKEATLGIVFVLLSEPEKAIQLLSLLSSSYNESVRFAVALGYGFIGTVIKDKSLHSKIKDLYEDKNPLVKQAAAVAFGLLH